MFAVLHLPQFALQAALRHEPELWARPVALVDPALSTPRVCDATPPARALGVTDGLTPTQALARCRDVLIRHRSPAQEAAATDAVLQCAYGFSPNIENTLPGTVTLDLHGLAELNTEQASSHSPQVQAEAPRIPTGFRHSAQGCRVREATLGTTREKDLQPQRGCTAPATDATPLGLREILLLSQGSSQTRNPGLEDGIPLGFAEPRLVGNNKASSLSPDVDSSAVRDRQDACPILAWAQRLHAALASLNLRARIGIGATPNIARHAAHWMAPPNRRSEEANDLPARNNPLRDSVLDCGAAAPLSTVSKSAGAPAQSKTSRTSDDAISIVIDPPAFVSTLPVAALEPSTDVALILHKWGIRTVGELLALGPDAVVDRLGLEALALFAAASTRALRPLNLVRPAERYEETFEFEHEIETVEPLLFILRRFVDYLSQRLELSGLAAALLTFRLRLESGEVLERRLRLPQPSRQADVLFRMLQTHLETLRTDSAIVAVALKADPTQPEQKQFSLFEAALRDPQQFQETLARLSALVGAERVGTPVRENSHRPDAFKLVPPDFENAPGALAGRVSEILRSAPMRRFRPALKAKVGGEALHLDERESPPPLSLQCAVANGKLVLAIGPWRASGRWWEPGAWRREEWDVQTSRGLALRLVRCPEGWFVEGVAD